MFFFLSLTRDAKSYFRLQHLYISLECPPPTPKGKAPTSSPKPSKVAKVAAQPPPKALDVEALGASAATHEIDACHTLVEQAVATGVEAALAKGRAADHKSVLARAETELKHS